jgi:hypothetical protein
MTARMLEGEIDAVRMSLDDAVDLVRGSVVPAPAAPHVTPNDVAERLRQLRAASDQAHRKHQEKMDSAIDELERKADELYAEVEG